MSLRFKIALLSAFLGMLFCVSPDVGAQTVVNKSSVGVLLDKQDSEDYFTLVDQFVSLTGSQYNLSTNWKIMDIEVYQSDASGNIIGERLNNNASKDGRNWNNALSFVFGPSTTLNFAAANARLQTLRVFPSRVLPAYYGKTLCVIVTYQDKNTASTRQQDYYYFDVISAPELEDNSVGVYFNEDYGSNFLSVCANDEINLQISNVEYPFGNEPTYISDSYKALYSWKFDNDVFGISGPIVAPNTVTSNSVSIVDQTKPTYQSSYIQISVSVTFVDDADNVISLANASEPSTFVGLYAIQYDSPVSATFEYNSVESTSFEICEENSNNVEIGTFIEKDGIEHESMDWKLYRKSPSDSDWVLYDENTYNPLSSNPQSLTSLSLGSLPIIGGVDTKYDFKLEIVDRTEYCKGCPSEHFFDVTILEQQADIKFPSIGALCEGSSIEFDATVDGTSTYTYKWYFDGVEQTGLGSTLHFAKTGLAAGAHTITLEASHDGCSVSKDLDINVTANPVLTSLGDVETCFDSAIEIGAKCNQTGCTFAWLPDEGDVVAYADGTKRSVKPAATQVYTITATNADGCVSLPVNVTVSVNSRPDVQSVTVSASTICEGSTTNLTATLASSYAYAGRKLTYTWTWTDSNGSHSETTTAEDTNTSTLNAAAISSTTTVSVSVSDDKGCTSTTAGTVDIEVIDLPVFAPKFGADAICGKAENQIYLEMNPAGGASYSYSIVPQGAALVVTESGGAYYVKLTSDYHADQLFEYEITAFTTGSPVCSSTETASFTVNLIPEDPIVSIEPSTGICEGSGNNFTVTITNHVAGYQYQWFKGGVSQSDLSEATSFTFTGITSTTNCSVIAYDLNKEMGCESNEVDFTLVVNPRPAKPSVLISTSALCNNDLSTVTLSLVGSPVPGETYTWYNAATNVSVGSGASLGVDPSATTSYYMIAYSNMSCPSEKSDNVTVTVNPAPVLTIVEGSQALCEGTPAVLSVTCDQPNSQIDYVWSPAGGTTTSIDEGGSKYQTVGLFATTDFQVVATNKVTGCEVASSPMTVTVNPKPTITITAPKSTICNGESQTYTINNTGYSVTNPKYSWIYYDGETWGERVNTDEPYIVLPLESAVGAGKLYGYLQDADTQCEGVNEFALTINELPTFNPVASPAEICDGESFSIAMNPAVAGAYDYTVTPVSSAAFGSSTGDSYDVAAFTPSLSDDETFTYKIVATNKTTSCASIEKTVDVKVNYVPAAPVVKLTPESICKDSNKNFTATIESPIVDATYTWYKNGSIVSSGSATSYTFMGVNATTDCSVMVSRAGCDSPASDFTLVVNDYPDVPVITVYNKDVFCSAETIDPELHAHNGSAEPGVTYSWFNADTDELKWTGETFNPSITATTTYYVIASNAVSGCTAPSNKSLPKTITINESPVLGAVSPSTAEICPGESQEFSITKLEGDYTYQWYTFVGGVETILAEGTDFITFNYAPVAEDVTKDVILYVRAIDNVTNCESVPVQAEVKVARSMDVAYTANPGFTICNGNSLSLVFNSFTASNLLGSYVVDKFGASVINDSFSPSETKIIEPKEGHLYIVQYMDNETCCRVDDTLSIVITEKPIFTIGGDLDVCDGGTLNLSVEMAAGTDYNSYEYHWTYGGLPVGDERELSISSFSAANAGDYSVKVIDKSGINCEEDATVTTTLVALPVVTLSSDMATVCAGGAVEFTATAGMTSYEFFVNGVSQGVQTSETLLLSDLTDGDVVSVIAIYNNCSSIEQSLTVARLPEFTPTIEPAAGFNFCNDEEVTITVASTQIGHLIADAKIFSDDVVTITPVDFVIAADKLSADVTVKLSGVSDASVALYAKVETENGCLGTTTEIEASLSSVTINDFTTPDLCQGATQDFTVTAEGALGNTLYQFLIDGVEVQAFSTTNTYSYTAATVGTITLVVNAKDESLGAGACVSTITKTFDVTLSPQFAAGDIVVNASPVSPNEYEACAGTAIEFEVAVPDDMNLSVLVDGVEIGYFDDAQQFVASASFPDFLNGNNPEADTELSKFSYSSTAVAPNIQYNISFALVNADGHLGISFQMFDPATGCKGDESFVSDIQSLKPITYSVPAPFAFDGNNIILCEGSSTTLTINSDYDASFTVTSSTGPTLNGVTTYDLIAAAAGDTEKITILGETSGCSATIYVNTVAAPTPSIAFEDSEGNALGMLGSDYESCSVQEVKLIADGALTYTLTVDKDGVDVTDSFTNSFDNASIAPFEQTLNLEFDPATAGANDFNLYTFNFTYAIGACTDNASATLRVYSLPDATLELSPVSPIISGTTVTATVTSAVGVAYDFYANGVQVSTVGNTSNTFDFASVEENTVVSVDVFNAHGCVTTVQETISVLDEVTSLAVVASSEFYCEDVAGVDIEVVNPQVGITYELNGCATCAPITVENASDRVVWYSVENAADVETYSVSGYHLELPSAKTDMANTVTITKVYLPTVQKVLPYGKIQDSCASGDEIKLESSETDVIYKLYVNGSFIAEAVGNGSELVLSPADYVGVYTVEAHRIYLGNEICPVQMDADYKVEVPDANSYAVGPDNGNYCENTAGVEIQLLGSDTGFTYYLYQNGALYLDAESNPVTAVGTGDTISFAHVTDDATYSVMAEYNGCKTPMTGSVSVVRYALPIEYAVTVNNEGHFCEGDAAGVTITVAGQENGKLYSLLRDGDVFAEISGNSSGASFDFLNVNQSGSYTVRVSEPLVDDGCAIILPYTIDVVEEKLPADIYIALAQDTICESSDTELVLYNTEVGVQYDVYVDGVLYRNIIAADAVHHEANVNAAGIYTVVATKSIEVAGVVVTTCSRDFDVRDTLTVLPRPLNGPQLEEIFVYTDTGADPCYGADISVVNAQVGLTYRLYLLDSDSNPLPSPSGEFVAVGDGSTDMFLDVRNNNGIYRIAISNGICEDWLTPDLTIISDKYVEVQTVIAETSMCQGDQGSFVTLANAEKDVTYILRDAAGNVVAEYVPDVAGSFTFDMPIINEGHYQVVGTRDGKCETLMQPELDFKVYPLPISYELEGNTKICAGDSVVTLRLAESEIGVNYVLYSVADDDVLTIVDQKEGTGFELSFEPVPAGTYMASSRNVLTKCTSNMKGKLTVVQGEAIKVFDITDEYTSCNGISEYIFPNADLTLDATYYIMSGDLSPESEEPVFSFTYDGSNTLAYTFAAAGEYTLWASYDDLSCLTPMTGTLKVESVQYEQYRLTSNEEVNCSASSMELYLSSSQVGITYFLKVNDEVVEGSEMIGTGDKLTWNIAGEDVVMYEVWASDGDKCPMMIDHLNVNFTTVVVPNISLDFYVEGVKQDYAEDEIIDLCPGVSFSFLGQLHNMTASRYTYKLNDEIVQDGTNPLFIPDVTGKTGELVYTLSIATNTGCEFAVEDKYTIRISTSYEQFRLSSNQDVNCEVGNMQLYLSGSQADITYQLKVGGEVVADSEMIGTGKELTWPIDGNGVVVYEVWATDQGKCPYMLDRLSVDFDRVVEPQVSLDFYLQGDKINYSATDTTEVCANASVNFLAQLQNMTATAYTYKMDGKVVSNNANPLFIPYLEDKTGTHTYTLDISTNTGCNFEEVASVTIKISEPELSEARLFAENDYPEYCEGEEGVRLYFSNAEKGVLYRLYRQNDSGFDDLMELVEIPEYADEDRVDTLWFESWTTNGKRGVDFAPAGVYYVEMESLVDGCMFRSNSVEVIVNPLPVMENTEVYFNVPIFDKSDIDHLYPIVDPETMSYDYGLLDAGYLVLEHASAGVRYDLFNVDSALVLQTIYATRDDQTLFFGPINQFVIDEPDNTVVPEQTDSVANITNEDDSSEPVNKAASDLVYGAEGYYTIVATNEETGCSTEIGNVEFIEDELVAYNVYVFLNKNETSVKKSLIPAYGQKGNHKYIDWSSKIDLVYNPKYQASVDGSLEITSDPNEDLYARNTGYTSIERRANIVFEILPAMKEVTLNDTTHLPKWEAGCDSVFNVMTRYFTVATDTTFTEVDGVKTPETFRNDTTWFNEPKEGAEKFESGFYSYFMVGEYKTMVADSIFGNAGFDDFNPSTPDLQQVSKTGMFVYNKRPSFFGREDVRYRIYNSLLPNVRKSNEATIQILCGNETVGDSTTVFLIPNAFSPNGDGFNDEFKILLPYQYEQHSESSLEVYNRWGTLVYRSSGNQYGRDCPWWDGTSKTSNMLTLGEKLPSGTYFYVYKITFIDAGKDSKLTRKINGFIELRR